MSNGHYGPRGQPTAGILCHTLCITATWIGAVAAFPQGAATSATSRIFGLIPSRTSFPPGLIPSAPRTSSIIPSDIIAVEPPESSSISTEITITTTTPPRTGIGLIPSKAPGSSEQLPTSPSSPLSSFPSIIPSVIPSAIPSGVDTLQPTSGLDLTLPSNATATPMPTTASTDEPLRPIPGPTTNPGSPDGHHEIPEPNFTKTSPCKGCSPIIEITATGWDDFWTHPAAEPQETTQRPPAATITAGPSSIVVKPGPSGTNFLLGTATVAPGQTVIVDKTPIVIQTSNGSPQVVVGGTQTVPLQLPPTPANNAPSMQITNPPAVMLPVVIGSQTFTPIASTGAAFAETNNANPPSPDTPSEYVVEGQTLLPGGAAVTISGTTYSLDSSATVMQVNGQYTTLTPAQGVVFTTTTSAALTLFGKTITANRAGYYVLAPGVTIIPGGMPVTYSGTVVSVVPEGTAAVIQGTTTMLQPATTIVTSTRTGGSGASGGIGEGSEGEATGSAPTASTLPYPSHNAAAVGFGAGAPGGLEGFYALFVLVVGWAAVWL